MHEGDDASLCVEITDCGERCAAMRKNSRLRYQSECESKLFQIFYFFLMPSSHRIFHTMKTTTPSEGRTMAGQTQYFYTVELIALEEHLSHSMDRVALLREKAIKRNDLNAADQIDRLQKVINVVQRRIKRLQ